MLGKSPRCNSKHAGLRHCSEFKLKSRYYIHFQTNYLGKGMNLFIPQAMG